MIRKLRLAKPRLVRGFLLLALAGSAHAQSIEVNGAQCADRIQVRAQAARLGDVLQRLSDATGFRLAARTALDQPVSIDRTASLDALLKELGAGLNLVVQTTPSKACGGRQVVSDVWVLPAGDAAAVASSARPRRSAEPKCEGPGHSPQKQKKSKPAVQSGHGPPGGRGRERSHPEESNCTTP